MNRIIVLGGSGFVGSALINRLVEESYDVIAIEHNSQIGTNIKKISADIQTPLIFDEILQENDIVVNLVGQITKNEQDFVQSNILGNINLLNSCIKKKIQKIIFLSTINVYGENIISPSLENDELNPNSMYALVKFLVEDLYKFFSNKKNLNVSILRMSNIYGPDKKSGFIGNLINSLVSGKKTIVYHNGNQSRDFLYLDDAIDAILKVIVKNPEKLEIFNISSGIGTKITDLILLIEKISGKTLPIEFNSQTPDEKYLWANNSNAKIKLNFSPKNSLEEDLKKIINNI